MAPPRKQPAGTRKALDRLLDARNEHPEQLAEIDARIRADFEQTVAVLVLDMCGFSRLTIRHGIIHYLAMIRRMHRAVLPEVVAAGGRLVKAEADNVFAIFPKASLALRCARAVQKKLARDNAALPEDWDVHVGIGIGYGPLLVVGDDDLFGSEMNLASKLGEDVAKAGEILVTDAAFATLGASRRAFEAKRARLSGVALAYHRDVSRRAPRRTRAPS